MDVKLGGQMGEVYRALTKPPNSKEARASEVSGTFQKLGLDDLDDPDGIDSFEASPELNLRITQDLLLSEVGKKLEAMFSEHGIELSDYKEVDMSADATAQRIFDFSTGMIEIYRQQNPDLSEEELVDQFEETIRGAVKQGYEEAVEILEGMGIWGVAQDNAEQTMSLLDEKFDEFFAELRGEGDEGPVSNDPPLALAA